MMLIIIIIIITNIKEEGNMYSWILKQNNYWLLSCWFNGGEDAFISIINKDNSTVWPENDDKQNIYQLINVITNCTYRHEMAN